MDFRWVYGISLTDPCANWLRRVTTKVPQIALLTSLDCLHMLILAVEESGIKIWKVQTKFVHWFHMLLLVNVLIWCLRDRRAHVPCLALYMLISLCLARFHPCMAHTGYNGDLPNLNDLQDSFTKVLFVILLLSRNVVMIYWGHNSICTVAPFKEVSS